MAKAVAKKQSAELAVMDENMFAADAGVGVNDLGSEDLAIPFIKVLQKMSDELDDLDNAKAGDIFNTVTKDIVKGKDGIRLINCAYNLQYIEWEPRGTGTGAPHAIYGAGDEIPATERGDDNKDYVVGGDGRYLERTAQHYVLVVDEDGVTQQALLPMKSTQFKKSKQWNSAMRSLQISKDGVVEDVNVYQEAKLFAESIQSGQVNVKHVREEDKETSDEDVPF